MSIIIRLQNLPWAADSSDIRRYFAGLSIPEGGVHIVGGEMGDAFIAFSTDEDARLAMAKDGGKIHEMQIKLLLSSRQEMARVIERARQQNLALQSAQIVPPMQPPPFPIMQQLQQPIRAPTPVESDRRRGRSPTPPRRRSRERERLDSRDRRRSPDSRRSFSSKRDRSRSPPRSNRGSSRDRDSRDRRSDRSSRDDRRYSKDDSSRYSDSRFSERNRYTDEDHNNSRSQAFPDPHQESANQAYHNYPDQKNVSSNNNYSYKNSLNPAAPKDYVIAPTAPNNAYPFNNPMTTAISKDYPAPPSSNNYPYGEPTVPPVSKTYQTPYYNSSANELNSAINSVDRSFGLDKVNIAAMLNQANSALPSSYMQKTSSYDTVPYQQPFAAEKVQSQSETANQASERKRKSRFEPASESAQPLKPPSFALPDVFQKLGVKLDPQISSNTNERNSAKDYPPVSNMPRADWPQQSVLIKNDNWNNLSNTIQNLQNISDPKSGNPGSVAIPMDLDPPEDPPVIYSHNIIEPISSSNQIPARSNLPIRNNDVPINAPPRESATVPDRKQWHGPITQTMELQRVPYDTRMEDILHLFRNIPLNQSNVCIQGNNQRVDRAFIRFSSTRDFNEAMNSQPVYLRNCQIELIPCPASAFESAVASQKPRPKITPRETDLILQLRGLPFQCTEQDVVIFFSNLRILDLFLERQADGRCSGVGYVKFASMDDFKRGLTLNGKTIGPRYITIRISNQDMLDFARQENSAYQPAQKEPLSKEPMQRDPSLREPMQRQPPLMEPMQRQPPLREPMQRQPPRREPLQREPPPRQNMEREPPLREPIQRDPPQREPIQRDPPQREPMQREPSPKESMQREPLLKEPIGREPPIKEQTQRDPLMREPPKREMPIKEPPMREPPKREPPIREPPMREPPIREHPVRQLPNRELPLLGGLPMSPNKFGGRHPDFDGSIQDRDGTEPPMSKPLRGNFCIGIRGLPKSVTSANLGKFYREMDVTALGIHIIVDNNIPTGQAFVEVSTQREVDIAVSKNGTLFHNCRINMYSLSIQELDEILTMGVIPPERGPLLGKPADDNRPARRPLLPQAPALDNHFRVGRPPLDYHPNERMRPPGPMRGGRPMRPMGDRHIRPPMGRMRGYRPEGRRSPDKGPPGFGAPGCVVSVNNLHFNAGLEELLKFFSGFRITKDNIMRRYNEHQQPTGEARVCFENTKEALRAVRELDTKPIMGRQLHLALL